MANSRPSINFYNNTGKDILIADAEGKHVNHCALFAANCLTLQPRPSITCNSFHLPHVTSNILGINNRQEIDN
ncbi:glycoside hydrolase family 1 protein [Sesbania bispinosa]|nr:glycoside hydrolase family 1 protein [Sesbania bispinosa]